MRIVEWREWFVTTNKRQLLHTIIDNKVFNFY